MPSQFFGLYIAGSGLRASNAALNTTANNIANANTDGYSRQVVYQQANNALRVFTTYGCAGAGVDTIAIERVRDQFYNMKYWDNNCKLGEYEMKAYYCQTLEGYFTDNGAAGAGFRTIFNQMSNLLQGIIDNASSDTSKADFISSAKSLTDYFNNMYGNLQELQKDLNLEIKQTVDQINSLAEKISILNNQINTLEVNGGTANELRDQREKLVDELSGLIDVEIEDQTVYDPKDPTRDTGLSRYIVKIAGGQPLVDNNSYNSLTYAARATSEKVNQSDADGLYRIYWSNGNEFKLDNTMMKGKLKGLVALRDGNNNANFHGKAKSIKAAVPPVTDGAGNVTTPGTPAEVTIEVTEEYLKNMRECTLSDTGGTINIGNVVYNYVDWKFNEDGTYTFILADGENIPQSMEGKDAFTSRGIDYQGIPYYMEQMNAWIRQFAAAVNEIFMNGTNAYDEAGCIFFTANKNQGGQYGPDELDPDKENGLYELTAGNITIFADLLNDAALLGTRSSATVGVEECGQIRELVDLLNSKTKFSFRNGTAGELLETLLSDVMLNASHAETSCSTYGGLKTTIDNQRISISGVDEDEEAVNLVKFQNSYTLASKMIQTMTEIYDRLILQTGV